MEKKLATDTADVEAKSERLDVNEKLLATVARLHEAGFTTAATTLPDRQKHAARLAQAYEHYRYVRHEKVEALRQRFKEHKRWLCGHTEGSTHRHSTAGCPSETDRLVFMSLGNYTEVPPDEVVGKVIEAKNTGIFDSFELATTERHLDPDPIVFGRIEGVSDRFFIAEWGHDVSIADFLEKNEG